MKKTTTSITGLCLLGLLCLGAEARTVHVNNDRDWGAGSLRTAIGRANVDPLVTSIRFRKNIGIIRISDTLFYKGRQRLRINGRGAVVEPLVNTRFDLLASVGGGDLSVKDMTFQGSRANGILIAVPPQAMGTVSLDLRDVSLLGNASSGLYMVDREGEDKEGGAGAELQLNVDSCLFSGNGGGVPGLNGIRIREGGEGGITALIHRSRLEANGGSGADLDEAGPGDIKLILRHSTLAHNGAGDPGDPRPGIAVQERGAGDLQVDTGETDIHQNARSGADLGEHGPGDLRLMATTTRIEGNHADGMRVEEQDSGNLEVRLIMSSVEQHENNGIRVREDGDGDASLRLVKTHISGNKLSGLDAGQAGAGSGSLRLQQATFQDNGAPYAFDGLQLSIAGAPKEPQQGTLRSYANGLLFGGK